MGKYEVLIKKIKEFEKTFYELDDELHLILADDMKEKLDEAVDGFDNLRDHISDFEWTSTRLLEALQK
jgi:hypothetical protein